MCRTVLRRGRLDVTARLLIIAARSITAALMFAANAAPVAAQPTVASGRFRSCGLTGSTKQEDVGRLNSLKNRSTRPASIRGDITAAWMMTASRDDRGRFDTRDAARIRLFVTNVKPGGKETVNCGAGSVDRKDTHIEGNDVGRAFRGEPMIVEVSPRWRVAMATVGADWSTKALKTTLVGHWVEFTGWLFDDVEHLQNAENTTASVKRRRGSTPTIWRRTIWELHPVTSIRVVP